MARWQKTIALWVVLIVLFFVFYSLFSVPPGSAPASGPNGVLQLLKGLPVVFIVLFAIFFWVAWRRQARTVEGMRLFRQGRSLQALEIYEKQHKERPGWASALNAGAARLCLWKLDQALLDLQEAQRLLGTQQWEWRSTLFETLALTQALLGHSGAARLTLSNLTDGKPPGAQVALVEGILLVRAGDAAGAREKLGSIGVKQLGGSIGALARVVDGLCIETLTGELRHIDRVALFGETGPDELRKAWPELIAHVERAPAW